METGGESLSIQRAFSRGDVEQQSAMFYKGSLGMNRFAYTSYKHQRDRELLDQLSHAIFVLKIHAQQRLADYQLSELDVQAGREKLVRFLEHLGNTIRFVTEKSQNQNADMDFLVLADRFIKVNPYDVSDRLNELEQLRARLCRAESLRNWDFRFLDGLQSFLEDETAKALGGLYNL